MAKTIKKVVLVDLDGTTFDNAERAHLIPPPELRNDPYAWAPFNAACLQYDMPIQPVINVVNSLYMAGYYIVVLTSRGMDAAPQTKEQIYERMKTHQLVMRPMDCTLSPADWKEYAAREIGEHQIMLAIDDDDTVLQRYHDMGIVTLKPSTMCTTIKGNL